MRSLVRLSDAAQQSKIATCCAIPAAFGEVCRKSIERNIRAPSRAQMPLPPTTISRQRMHIRAVRYEGFRRDDGLYTHVAAIGASEAIVAYNLAHPISPGRNTVVGRTALDRRTVHLPDRLLDAEYDYPEAARLGGFRAMLGVPMLREGDVLGVVALWRDEPIPFIDAEIEVTQQFADEAVIALTTTQLVGTIERRLG